MRAVAHNQSVSLRLLTPICELRESILKDAPLSDPILNLTHRQYPGPEPDRRLVSLDVFRGLVVVGMILVTNPGTYSAVYSPLVHTQWDGWTATDLIFPAFLFAVGIAVTLSFATRLERGDEPFWLKKS